MNATSFELRGWHVLAAVLAFFGAVIAVNVVFAVYAVQSFPGEDVRRSYLQGLQYNDTLAERRAQAALGWQARAALRERDGGAVVEVTLSTRDGVPVDGALLTGDLQWPAASQFDHNLTFEPAGDGRYVAQVGELRAGRWRLRANAERGEGVLDFESELRWRVSR
jgi:nitrogen fixation protein FixH